MKFLILGSGRQGRACAFDLLQNPDVEQVLLADASKASLDSAFRFLQTNASPSTYQGGPPSQTARKANSKRIQTVRADASDVRRIHELAGGFDVMVSAVPYFLNLPLAKVAIAARVHFVDLGGSTEIVLQELALHERARRCGVTILPDVGLGPGMTTTIAEHGIRQLETVSAVLMRDGGLPQNPIPPMNYLLTFSEHGLITEYVAEATALRGGRRIQVPGLSEVEPLEIAPLGRLEAAHAAGGLSTLAWTYEGKIQTMDCKLLRYPGHIEVINAMKAMGFFGTRPVATTGRRVTPRELSARLLRRHFERPGEKDLVVIHTTVQGTQDGREVEITYDMLDRFDEKTGMTAMMRTTGFPASIVAQMLAKRVINSPGAYPVERGVPPGPFLEEIRRRGFNLSWRLRTKNAQPQTRGGRATRIDPRPKI